MPRDVQEPVTGRGRAKEAAGNDKAVLEAARLVFAVHGPDAPVSAVAAQAGVGIASLYRRYPTKVALLQFLCLESMRQLQAIGERAIEEPDAWDGLTMFVREGVAMRAGAFATTADAVKATEEMWAAAQRGNQTVRRLVEVAQQQGSLRADVTAFDLQLLIELFSRRRPDDGGAHERLLTIALDGLSARPPCTDLGAPAPTWATYGGRWRRSEEPL